MASASVSIPAAFPPARLQVGGQFGPGRGVREICSRMPSVQGMREQISRNAAARPELTADLQAALAEMQPEFDAEAEAMTERAAALYARKLSRRELADCAVFFAGNWARLLSRRNRSCRAISALLWTIGGRPPQWR